MKFKSSRGKVEGLSFEEALFTGYAADRGMLLPEHIPQISIETIKSWADLSYIQLAKKILPMFTEEEVPATDLDGILDKAYERFSHPDIAPVVQLQNGLNLMEMFHGFSWSFKDLSMACVGQLMRYFLEKKKRHLTVLLATSGDTGSSAIEAVRGMELVDIFVLLPRGRTSKIQELQMTTVPDSNVHVFRTDGASSEGDVPIQACFADVKFVKRHNLCSLNSLNVARIVMQTVHYFYAYLQVCRSCDQEVEIAIPTGGCGNVTAGYIAKRMGLPVKLVCCVTHNDAVQRILKHGDYSLKGVVPSLAPAMDIDNAYNMERLFYLFSNGDGKLVSDLMQELETKSKTTIPDKLRAEMSAVIATHVVQDNDIKNTMKICWDENNHLICPHTATTVNYHYSNLGSSKTPLRVCLAPASPAKFEEAVTAAGLKYIKTPDVIKVCNMTTRFEDWEKDQDWTELLRDRIEKITEMFESRNAI